MTALPAFVYDGVVTHTRRAPVDNQFRYRTQLWLVDLDHLPRLPVGLRWAARWRAVDHIGGGPGSLHDNVVAAFTRLGADVSGCRLLMLANPRGLGHGFNPISVHWAVDERNGEVRAVLAEVHNTYGGRHAYLLQGHRQADGTVTAQLDKELYVSPFYGTDGHYTIRVSAPGERITVVVRYQPEAGPVFVAAMTLDRTSRFGPAAALRHCGASWRTSALIRFQGIKLWARGVRINPRPVGHDQELSAARVPDPRRVAENTREGAPEVVR